MAVPFHCTRCNAKRTVELPCEPELEKYYANFVRCPACFRGNRVQYASYWVFLVVKAAAIAGILALVPLLSSSWLWIFPPLGLIAVWADHRRFLRRLDLALTAGSVTGGPPRERLPRPFA